MRHYLTSMSGDKPFHTTGNAEDSLRQLDASIQSLQWHSLALAQQETQIIFPALFPSDIPLTALGVRTGNTRVVRPRDRASTLCARKVAAWRFGCDHMYTMSAQTLRTFGRPVIQPLICHHRINSIVGERSSSVRMLCTYCKICIDRWCSPSI